MRSFNSAFNTERAKRGTAPINLVDFGFTTPLLVADRTLSIPVTGVTPVEMDFTEFAEVDPRSCFQDIAADCIRVDGLGMADNRPAYVCMDIGAALFGRADFTHQASFKVSSAGTTGGMMCVWGVADGAGFVNQQAVCMYVYVINNGPSNALYLTARGGSYPAYDAYTSLAMDTYYYLTISYNASTKAISCAIYSDAERTTLVDTLSVFMPNDVALQYLYAASGIYLDILWISGEIGPLSIDTGYIDVDGLVTDWSFVDSATDTARDLVSPVTAPDLELTLANTGGTPFSSLFGYQPVESVPVTLYQYFGDLPWDCAEVIFQGYVREVTAYNAMACTLLIQGLWAKYDRLIGRDLAVTRAAYANADPDAIGRMQPIVYGAVDNLPCLAVAAGAMSNLVADVTASQTSIELSDASVFPTSGTVQIDTEKIAYTGKSSNTLTGCTRGSSSTTAVAHDAGASAAQVLTSYVYLLAGHPVKSIGDVYVDGVRQTSGITKYTGQTGSVLTGYTGKAVIKFDALPVVSKQVNLVPDVDEGSHSHTASGSSTAAIPATGYSDPSASWSGEANAKDGDESTYAYCLGMNEGERLDITFARASLGTVASLRMKIVYSTALAEGDNYLYCQIDTSTKQYLPGTGGVDNKVTVYKTFARNQWSFTFHIDSDNLFIGKDCRIYEVSCEATYGVGVSAGPAEGILVTLTGNSSADTVIGGQVTADLEGYQDDASGTYTGTASALIQRPDHVFKHLLMARLGMGSDLIDAAAFTAAGTFFSTNSYAFALAVTQTEQAASLLARLAFQCRSFFRFTPYGKARLLPRQLSQSADMALGTSAIVLDSLSTSRTPTDILINAFTVHFDKDQTKAGSQAGDYLEATACMDSASITTYGERTTAREAGFYFDAVRDATMAAHVGAFYLDQHKRPRKMPCLSVFLDNMEAEPGDYVGITHPLDAMSGFVAEVLKTTHYLGSAKSREMDRLEIIAIDNGV